MRPVFILFVFLFGILAGCGDPDLQKRAGPEQREKTVQKAAEEVRGAPGQKKKEPVQSVKVEKEVSLPNIFKPFHVFLTKSSRQNHYVPSGFMPNGKCVTFVDTWQEKCYVGTSCVKIVYDVECSRKDQKWAGVYWLNPANNWGSRRGGFNLTGAKKLTFWARGEKGGEQIQEFTVGGISGDYPDSDTAMIGPVILGAQWRQYTIDLRGKDLSYISGGFSWTTSEDVNPQDCTFYLDGIRFE